MLAFNVVVHLAYHCLDKLVNIWSGHALVEVHGVFVCLGQVMQGTLHFLLYMKTP